MARADFKSMKMPEKKKPMEMSDEDISMDFESEPSEDAEAYAGKESPEEESMEGSQELMDISDDELLKEIQRRGLSLQKAAPKKMEEMDLESGQ